MAIRPCRLCRRGRRYLPASFFHFIANREPRPGQERRRMAAYGATSSLPPIPTKVASPNRQRPQHFNPGLHADTAYRLSGGSLSRHRAPLSTLDRCPDTSPHHLPPVADHEEGGILLREIQEMMAIARSAKPLSKLSIVRPAPMHARLVKVAKAA
jgi:hypothetical protein